MPKKTKKAPFSLNKFKAKDIDFKTQKVVSFTQFQLYNQCPHRWASQYGRGLAKPEPTLNLSFGTAIHKTVQKYIETIYNESGAAADRLDLVEMFEGIFKEEYKAHLQKNNQIHFSSPEEMGEFYEDGVLILNWLKKNRRKYFTSKHTFLVGIEMPIQKEIQDHIIFTGAIDLVLYEVNNGKFYIYDIKTSTKGWNEYNKKDENKTSQLLLYKQMFSELYGVSVDKIIVEFFILKRKIQPNEFVEFPKRVQTFRPVDGPIKMKQTLNKFNTFIGECFDVNGKFIEKQYIKIPSKLCDWCPFHNSTHCEF